MVDLPTSTNRSAKRTKSALALRSSGAAITTNSITQVVGWVGGLIDGGLTSIHLDGWVGGWVVDAYLNKTISQTDELRVGIQVFRGGHNHKLNRAVVAQLHVCPLTHGEDGLGRGHAVVGNQDLLSGWVGGWVCGCSRYCTLRIARLPPRALT